MDGWRAAQSPPDLLTVSTDSDSMASLRLLALAATLALASGETPGLELATKPHFIRRRTLVLLCFSVKKLC